MIMVTIILCVFVISIVWIELHFYKARKAFREWAAKDKENFEKFLYHYNMGNYKKAHFYHRKSSWLHEELRQINKRY